MNDAQRLAHTLNGSMKAGGLSYLQARATARKDGQVDWPASKAVNAQFNADVDGCESFVMCDGSVCQWMPGQYRYVGRGA